MLNIVGGTRRRAASSASAHPVQSSEEAQEDDTLIVEPEQGNVLMHIISQLRPGADLSRVVLPTFILEPRSMLERITNFMCHPEMLLPISAIEDPVERFVSVVKFYLSGWHIRPPGVKKPLNPILGEVFTCYWTFPDNTQGYYVSEQTSHHPPKSSYFYMAPEHHIRVDGTLKPRSRFLGNSAASIMEGTAVLSLLNRKKNGKPERYILTQPNMYARGILFGKMKYELGDHSFVRCPDLGLVADIEFKTKGWVSGTYNAIGGTVRNEKTGEVLRELSGLWSGEMAIKNLQTGRKEKFFNAQKAKPTSPSVRPITEQGDRESQRLWQQTAQAVMNRNHELATVEKTKVEDMQREEAATRSQEGDLGWIVKGQIDGKTADEQTAQILAIYPILPGQKTKRGSVQAIPPRTLDTAPSGAAHAPVEGSLIDVGSSDNTPAANEKSDNSAENALEATGQQPAPLGALLDFQQDLGKDLPDAHPSDASK
ncbi:oxysterol-binding protein [Grosmannia clavigera kw1407]|uniref:Oxysterol-binding protein n=1 Tax=Grosmannia clavigera (strain kw1407 / UAMH 11150) TaxID=655863 RepID=F0XHF0_GROCL|nr:oxysterol-binding protein [Grosmannia clavigera kw1407]EFX03307.1 oxysterol-binding protein [Grosmannia clavigera kw1407]